MPVTELDRPATKGPEKPRIRDWVPGRYNLRDAWIPVAQPHHVTGTPIRRLIHSRPYYLWRDRDGLHAAEFHPNEFNARRGKFTEFTGLTGHYPVIERFGSVWAWYGNPENADADLVPDVPFMPRDGGLPSWMYSNVQFNACSELSLENLIDTTHANFLHAGINGDDVSESDEVTFQATSETVTMLRERKGVKTPAFMRKMGVKADTVNFFGAVHIMVRSHVALVIGKFEPGFTVRLFHPSIPESPYRCRINACINTSDAPIPFKWVMPRSTYQVGPEDNIVLLPQGPRYMDPTDRRDYHSRFDAPGVAYRFLIQRIAERQKNGDFSYAADGHPGRDITELLRIKRVD